MTMKVKTKFTADEEITSIARRIDQNVRRLNQNMRRGFNKSTKSALNFRSATKALLTASIVQKGFGMLQQGVSHVTSEFTSFDDAITAAAVRFKDIGPDAKDFNERLNTIKKAAREAGATTVKTATESAHAMDFLARAGFTSEEAIGGLRSMINLSIATGEDFARVADISSDLLGAFGLAVNDPIQKIKNLNRLNDVLVKTANSANVTVENMFETMKDIGPIAAGILNVELEEVAALTAILGDSGIKGTNAMTALKNAYLNLAAPVGRGADIMKIFGLKLSDGVGGVRSLTDVLKELNEKMQVKGLDPVQQAAVMDAIFGKRAIAGAKNLQDNINNVAKFREMLDKAGDTAEKSAIVMQTSLGNQIKGLGSALTELGFKVLEPFDTDVKNIIKSLTTLFRELDPKPLVDGIKTLTVFFAKFYDIASKLKIMKDLVITFGLLEDNISNILKLFSELEMFKFSNIIKNIKILDTILKPFEAKIQAINLGLEGLKKMIEYFKPTAETREEIAPGKARKEMIPIKDISPKKGFLRRIISPLFHEKEEEEERKEREEHLKLMMGRFNIQPKLNVNVENKIASKGITVDTKITAPGTTNLAGVNIF